MVAVCAGVVDGVGGSIIGMAVCGEGIVDIRFRFCHLKEERLSHAKSACSSSYWLSCSRARAKASINEAIVEVFDSLLVYPFCFLLLLRFLGQDGFLQFPSVYISIQVLEWFEIDLQSYKIQKLKVKRMKMAWRDNRNKIDCGVFLMHHMETFRGQLLELWNCGLQKENKDQLNALRVKYLTALVMSDLNEHRA
nr:uncharacterized protein LOC109171666 [Ipomoea batatas]